MENAHLGRVVAEDVDEIEDQNATTYDRVEPQSKSESETGCCHSPKSTKSLTESFYDEVIENDRRYANHTYFMPMDQAEQTRLQILHNIYLFLFKNDLFRAPISPSIDRILDVGTGPGDWAIAMAQQYPHAQVIASDIGVFDIKDSDVPNVQFEIDDVEEEWSYNEPFDFIHLRGMSGAVADWSILYSEAYRNLVPGGYIEVIDWDYAELAESCGYEHLNVLASAMRTAAEAAGYPRNLEHLKLGMLSAAGLTIARSEILPAPLGTWHQDPRRKTIGKMALVALLEGLEAASLRLLTRHKGWTVENVKAICANVATDLQEQNFSSISLHVIVAQRPFEAVASNI